MLSTFAKGFLTQLNKLFAVVLLISLAHLGHGQSLPGGVGNISSPPIWFRPDNLSPGTLTSWTSVYGGISLSSGSTPQVVSGFANGKPSLYFNGTDNYISGVISDQPLDNYSINSDILEESYHCFIVLKPELPGPIIKASHQFGLDNYSYRISDDGIFNDGSDNDGLFVSIRPNTSGACDNQLESLNSIFRANSQTQLVYINKVVPVFGNYSIHTSINGGTPVTTTIDNQYFECLDPLAKLILGEDVSGNFKGHIAEVIFFPASNVTERIVIENYLASKYGISLGSADKFQYDNVYYNNVIGIGQEGSTDNHLVSNNDQIFISSSNIANGNYAFIGDNGLSTSINTSLTSAPATARMDRVWRFEKTTGFGTINIGIKNTELTFEGSYQYPVLIIDNTDNFNNAPRVIVLNNQEGYYLTEDITLNSGDYITFGYLNKYDPLALCPNAASTECPIAIGSLGRLDPSYLITNFYSSGISIVNPRDLDDQEYILMGNDNMPMQYTNSSTPIVDMLRMDRIWGVNYIGAPGNVDIIVDPAIFPAIPGGYSSLSLLIDSDKDFSNAQVVPLVKEEMVYKAYNIALSHGLYITLAVDKVEIIKTVNDDSYPRLINVSGTTSTWEIEALSAPNTERISRIWQYSVEGNNNPVNLSISQSLFTLESYQVPVLITDENLDFTQGAKVRALTLSGTQYEINDLTLTAGHYLTFGKLNIYTNTITGYPSEINVIGKADAGFTKENLASGGLILMRPSSLGIGDYFLVGHNNLSAEISLTNTPSSEIERSSRVWKFKEYKDVGELEVVIDPALFTFTSTEKTKYVLLLNKNGDGDFADAEVIGMVKEGANYKAYYVNFQNGDELAIGVAEFVNYQDKDIDETFTSIAQNSQVQLVTESSDNLDYASPCKEELKEAYLNLLFNTGENFNFAGTTFTAQAQIQIKGYNTYDIGSATPVVTHDNIEVTVTNTHPEALYYLNVTEDYKDKNVKVYEIIITQYTASGNAAVNAALTLRAYIEEDFRVKVPETEGSPIKTLSYNVNGNVYSFNWTTDQCPSPSYQFQLLRLYNIDKSRNGYTNIKAEVDWSKALTLETSSQTLNLTMVEGTGFYAWRVRPIGDFYDGGAADNRNWGTWSTSNISIPQEVTLDGSANMASCLEPFENSIFYYSQFDEEKNFIYNRVFTEDTKIHESITYANGLLQVKQTQTKVPSNYVELSSMNGEILASQTLYDYSGRPSLTMMGAPLIEVNNQFGYREQLAQNNSELYGPSHFDEDDNYDDPLPITGGLINQYYSNLNPEINIPSADNYPFSRSLFYDDGSGRVKETGGPGLTHKLGAGHTTRTSYSAPADIELLRVFGDEAPNPNDVIKVSSTDANNITSISYLDKSGKTLATCLVSTDPELYPTNLEKLPSDPENGVEIEKVFDNDMPYNDNGLISSYIFNFFETTEIKLYYKITPKVIEAATCGEYCSTCGYKVVIKIESTDGTTENNSTFEQTIAPGEFVVGATCNETELTPYNPETITLPAGQYKISKTVELDMAAAKVYADKVVEEVEKSLEPVLQQINTKLQATDIDELFDYLEGLQTAPPTGLVIDVFNEKDELLFSSAVGGTAVTKFQTGFKVGITAPCCSLKIPIIVPEKDPCEDETVTSNLGQFFLDELAKKLKSDNTPYTLADLGITNYSNAEFITLINNMSQESYYTCDDLLTCWKGIIFSAGTNQAGTEVSFTEEDGEIPDWGTGMTGNVPGNLEQFLECAGYHYEAVTTDATLLKVKPYKYFEYYAGKSPICEDAFCNIVTSGKDNAVMLEPGDEGYISPCIENGCTMRFVNPGPEANTYKISINNDADPEDDIIWEGEHSNYMTFAQCVKNSVDVPVEINLEEEVKEDIEAQKKKLESQCVSECDNKYDEFLYQLKKLYDPDNDGNYFTANQVAINEDDLCCTAKTLVSYCKDQCELTIVKADCEPLGSDNGEDKLISLGTKEERELLQAIMNGTFELMEMADPLPAGFEEGVGCLVGYYSFEGDAEDKSGRNFDGTVTGADLSTDRYNAINSAYEFANATDIINCSNSDRKITTEVTVSAWVYTTSTAKQWVAGKDDGVNGFRLFVNSGKAYFGGYDGSGVYKEVMSSVTITDSKWHHLVGVCDKGVWQIWVDGVLDANAELEAYFSPTATLANTEPFTIGRYYLGDGGIHYPFEGKVDEVRLYRCALNKEQIEKLYAPGDSYDYTKVPQECREGNYQLEWGYINHGQGYYFEYVFPTKDGGYIALDRTGVLLKIGPSGSLVWSVNLLVNDGRLLETSEGDYLFAGTQYGDYYFAKISKSGAIIWEKTIGGSGSEYLKSELKTSDDHFVFAGTSNSNDLPGLEGLNSGNNDIYIIKINSSGDVLNKALINARYETNFHSNVIKETKLGYIYISGTRVSETVLFKLNNDLTTVWEKSYNGGDYPLIESVEVEGCIVASNKAFDVHLAKISKDGIIVWEKSIGGGSWESIKSIRLTSSGDYLLGMSSSSSDLINVNSVQQLGHNYYLILLDKDNGNILQENVFGGNNTDLLLGTIVTKDNGFVIYGLSSSTNIPNTNPAWGYDLHVIKTNSKFEVEFEQIYGGISHEASGDLTSAKDTRLATTPDGGFVVSLSLNSYNQIDPNKSGPAILKFAAPKTSCDPQTVAIKWIPPTITVFPPPECCTPDPTHTTKVAKETVKEAIETQMAKCELSNRDAILSEYTSKCLGTKIKDELKVTYNFKYHHYTLYYYDRAGNLVKTVPPEGVDEVDHIVEHPEVLERKYRPQHTLVTTYKYNSLGQLVEQNSPDGGTTHFIYNKLGQLRFSQNDKQVEENKFSYTKYDYLGRIIEVGESVLPAGVNDFMALNSPVYLNQGSYDALGANSFPVDNNTQQTITVYSQEAGNADYLGKGQRFVQNRVSYTYTHNLKGDRSVTYYSYDPHGNVEWLAQEVPGLGKTTVGYEYDLISNKVLKVKYNERRTDQFFHKYSYDADNRITGVYTSRDGRLWDKDAGYSYYKHGPLKRMELGEDKVQGLDYTYTLHGWLKAINTPRLKTDEDPGQDGAGTSKFARDEFGMVLGYHMGDFTRTGSVFNTSHAYSLNSEKPLFNGNISSWVSRIEEEFRQSIGNENSNPGEAEHAKFTTGNLFEYDQLNRILNSNYRTFNGTSYDASEDYATTYQYDANGNIQSLNRNGYGSNLEMDKLSYTYDPVKKNQLISVSDAANDVNDFYKEDLQTQPSLNYEYDDIGNLIKDADEKIEISWNVYGKISEIKPLEGSTKPHITFTYDASGNRIKKEVNSAPFPYTNGQPTRLPANLVTTYYVRDASGNIMGIYERTNELIDGQTNYYTATFRIKEIPIYGSSRVGQIAPGTVVSTKVFHLNDADKVEYEAGVYDRITENTNWISLSENEDVLTDDESQQVAISKADVHAIQFNGTNYTSSITDKFQGEAGKNVAVAEDLNGGLKFYAVTAKKYFGASNICLVYDTDDLLMPNSIGINSDANAKSVIVQKPGSSSLYYLITRGTDSKLYYTIIDMTLPGNGTEAEPKGDILEGAINIPLDAVNEYGASIVAIENLVEKKAIIYATRSIAPVGNTLGQMELVVIELDDKEVAEPKIEVMATVASLNVTGQSELTLSPDNKKLLVYNHKERTGWFDHQESEILVYNIGYDYKIVKNNLVSDQQIVIPGGTFSGVSAEFSEDQRYIFYTRDLLVKDGSTTPSPNVLWKADLRNGTQDLVAENSLGDLRRGLDDKLYIVNTQEANASGYTQNEYSVSSISGSISIGQSGNKLAGALPLQNVKIFSNSIYSGTVAREVGKKHYELSDHLGNVTVVIGDTKRGARDEYGPTLVENGDFNQATDGLGDGWAWQGGGAYAGIPSIVTGNGFTGNAQRVVMPAGKTRFILKQDFVVETDAIYRISFKYRSNVNFAVVGNTANGNGIYQAMEANPHQAAWFTFTDIASGIVAGIYFDVNNKAEGDWIEVDEVVVTKVGEDGSPDYVDLNKYGQELIINGNFDNATSGIGDNWKFSPAYTGNASIVTGNGFTGNAQRIEIPTGITRIIFRQMFPVIDGKEYQISFKYRSNQSVYMTGTTAYGNGFSTSLVANTGNAQLVSVTKTAQGTEAGLFFDYNHAEGDWLEIDEFSVVAIEPANTDPVYLADVISYTNYYPFGQAIEGRTYKGPGVYRYGFNGKEKDSEWNSGGAMYDYGFRIYDPRIAKFLSVDPLTSSYPWYTPYQYAGNSPILSVDIDGLEPSENLNNNETKSDENSSGGVIGLAIGIGKGVWKAAENRVDFIQSLKTEEGRTKVVENFKQGVSNLVSSLESGPVPFQIGHTVNNYLFNELPNKSAEEIGSDIGSRFYNGVNAYSDGLVLGGGFNGVGVGLQKAGSFGLDLGFKAFGYTKAGRWMSFQEYQIMYKTSMLQQQHILTKGSFGFYAQTSKRSVYSEFYIKSNLLKTTNQQLGWAIVKPLNAMEIKLAMMKKITLDPPRIYFPKVKQVK